MGFFHKLFKKESKKKYVVETSEKTDLKKDEGIYILNKDILPKFTYAGLAEKEYECIKQHNKFLKDSLSQAFKFSQNPINHPQNLDEYLIHWFSAGFGLFLEITPEKHMALLAYNFGQYMVDTYNMEWKVKSDYEGNTQTVIRMLDPVELELYPIEITIRAFKNQEMTIYVEIPVILTTSFRSKLTTLLAGKKM